MTLYISPYRRLVGLRESMDRLLKESEAAPVEREMTLAVDVTVEEDGYVIRALVPGLEGDDLNIEILNDTVAIRGEFKALAGKDTRYLVSELPQGRFSRVISLPVAVDAGKAEATIKNGLLTLRVPRMEAYRPKAIKVNLS